MIFFPRIHASALGQSFEKPSALLKLLPFQVLSACTKQTLLIQPRGFRRAKNGNSAIQWCVWAFLKCWPQDVISRKPTDWYVLWQKPVICHFFFVVTKDRETSRRSSGQNTSEWITVRPCMCASWFSSSGSATVKCYIRKNRTKLTCRNVICGTVVENKQIVSVLNTLQKVSEGKTLAAINYYWS